MKVTLLFDELKLLNKFLEEAESKSAFSAYVVHKLLPITRWNVLEASLELSQSEVLVLATIVDEFILKSNKQDKLALLELKQYLKEVWANKQFKHA